MAVEALVLASKLSEHSNPDEASEHLPTSPKDILAGQAIASAEAETPESDHEHHEA